MGFTDKHCNIFYSYNHSNELIENNLTRAFIVTLSLISKNTCSQVLHLLDDRFKEITPYSVRFALQNNIYRSANPKNFENKFIVTISIHKYFEEQFYIKENIDSELIKNTLQNKKVPKNISEKRIGNILQQLTCGSIPDAWIYDNDQSYCFLIECKKQYDSIYYPQIIRHAYENFGMTDISQIEEQTIRLTWHEILFSFIQKSGGVRVIYYFYDNTMPLFLLTVFGKNEKENLSRAERNKLAGLTGKLVELYKGKIK